MKASSDQLMVNDSFSMTIGMVSAVNRPASASNVTNSGRSTSRRCRNSATFKMKKTARDTVMIAG